MNAKAFLLARFMVTHPRLARRGRTVWMQGWSSLLGPCLQTQIKRGFHDTNKIH